MPKLGPTGTKTSQLEFADLQVFRGLLGAMVGWRDARTCPHNPKAISSHLTDRIKYVRVVDRKPFENREARELLLETKWLKQEKQH